MTLGGCAAIESAGTGVVLKIFEQKITPKVMEIGDVDMACNFSYVNAPLVSAMRAFHDYMPTRQHPLDPQRIFTSFPYGPSLEVFRLDLRSYRGPNNEGMATELSPEARILGEAFGRRQAEDENRQRQNR